MGECDEVCVVWHEAVGPNVHPTILAGLGHEIEIRAVVVLVEEGRHPAIAALGDMMGNSWCNNAGNSRHALDSTNKMRFVKVVTGLELSMVSPE